MSCAYCFGDFDLDSKLPILLSCSHTYCQECILKLSEIMRYCPLDRTLVDFSMMTQNSEILDQLKFQCEVHEKSIIGLCESCSEFFCSGCKSNHSSCKTVIGTYTKLKSQLVQTIESALMKSLQISETLKNDKVISFDDGIVWIEEYLKYLNDALIEIDFAKKNTFCGKSIVKIIEKYKNLGINPLNAETENKNQEIDEKSLTIPVVNPNLNLDFNSGSINSDQINMFQDILRKMIENPSTFSSEIGVDNRINDIVNKLNNSRNSYLIYFTQIRKNKNDYGKYFCYFSHSLNNPICIQGFAFGRPSQLNNYIYVNRLEVKINEEILVKDGLLIDYHSDEIVFEYYIKNSFLLVPGVELYIEVEIEGNGNYLFSEPDFDSITAKGVDGEKYSENFPILYFF